MGVDLYNLMLTTNTSPVKYLTLILNHTEKRALKQLNLNKNNYANYILMTTVFKKEYEQKLIIMHEN